MTVQQDAAALCRGIYAYPGDPSVPWDHFDDGSDDGVCWALKRAADQDFVVLRGSTTFEDWVRDFDTVAAPWGDADLGPVHPGFRLGMSRVRDEVLALLSDRPVVVTGHSLGAGRACILTGLLTLAGRPPATRVCFGEPKPGFGKLAAVIAGTSAFSYRNGSDGLHHDLVTDVPFSFPPEEYVHPTTMIMVSAPPPAGDAWGMFAWHHMQLYQRALQ